MQGKDNNNNDIVFLELSENHKSMSNDELRGRFLRDMGVVAFSPKEKAKNTAFLKLEKRNKNTTFPPSWTVDGFSYVTDGRVAYRLNRIVPGVSIKEVGFLAPAVDLILSDLDEGTSIIIDLRNLSSAKGDYEHELFVVDAKLMLELHKIIDLAEAEITYHKTGAIRAINKAGDIGLVMSTRKK